MAKTKRRIIAYAGLCAALVVIGAWLWVTRGWEGTDSTHRNLAAGVDFYSCTYKHRGQEEVVIHAVVMDPAHVSLSIVAQPGTGDAAALDFVGLADHHNALVMVNGGYFDHAFKPVGLFIQDGTQIADALDQPPLSAVIQVKDSGELLIVPTTRYSPSPDHLSAIQAGPYLVDPGGTPGIYSDDFKRAKRTAIGITGDGQIVVLVTSPCSLFQLSEILTGAPEAIGVDLFECVVNLDGGPSSGLYLETLPDATRPSEDAVPIAIVVRPR